VLPPRRTDSIMVLSHLARTWVDCLFLDKNQARKGREWKCL
jgi:hypothetical protein